MKSPVQVTSGPGKPGPSAEFTNRLLEPGGVQRVLERLRATRKAGQAEVFIPELILDRLARDASQAGRLQDAVELCALNVEAYPNSSYAHDNLSAAYLAAENRAKALEFAQKALEALARDTATPERTKQGVRQRAEARIQQLTSSTGAAQKQ